MFCAAGNFWDYELTFLSVAVRDAVSKKLLETVTGGPAKLMMLVNKSAAGVRCNPLLHMELSGSMSCFQFTPLYNFH